MQTPPAQRRSVPTLGDSGLNLGPGNGDAKAFVDNSLFAGNSESETVASSKLSADYYAISGSEGSSWLADDSH
jgi:hypothetical protein